MDVLTFTDTRANLKEVMERVVNDHAPVVVTRQKAEAVVIVSLADWNALEETSRLLSSPANARRLRDAIEQLERQGGSERDLIEPCSSSSPIERGRTTYTGATPTQTSSRV